MAVIEKDKMKIIDVNREVGVDADHLKEHLKCMKEGKKRPKTASKKINFKKVKVDKWYEDTDLLEIDL